MKDHKALLLMWILTTVTIVLATEFRQCSRGQPLPDSVDVSGCNEMPCQFIRGRDLEAFINFTTAIPADNMKPLVRVTLVGMTIKYPLENQDACADLVYGGCPLKPGDPASYKLVVPILETYPMVSMTIEFSLLDQTKAVVTCFTIDGQVVD